LNFAEARCWGVIPAAGTGSRMGGETPKQYLEVAGVTLIEHSLNALLGCEQVAGIVVALHAGDQRVDNLAVFRDPRVQTVIGAGHRSGSVLAGLDALAPLAAPGDWVLVHDAARPCLRREDLQRLLSTVMAGEAGGILAEPIRDTVKQATGKGLVERTLDRTALWRAQTPQMFRLEELRRALREAEAEGREVTDEASAMEMAGFAVQLVPGSPSNVKVTVPDDLSLAGWYLGQGLARESE